MCFPEIFVGKGRMANKDRERPMQNNEIVKSEILNTDRRCGQNIPNLFYKLRKTQIKHVSGKGLVAMRRKTGKNLQTNSRFTDREMEEMKTVHEGRGIFRNFRLSPTYLEKAKKDAFAMVRQKGKPAFLCHFL